MAGQLQNLNDDEILSLINLVLPHLSEARLSMKDVVKFKIGNTACQLRSSISGIFGDYIGNAFLEVFDIENPAFVLEVWQNETFWNSPECEKVRRMLPSQVSRKVGNFSKYRIAHQPYEEMIFLFDLEAKTISVLIGPSASRNLASYVTPFRIAIDWIAQENGAIALHASAVAYEGFGLALTGLSGSGKSTLAVNLMLNGLHILADDVVVADEDQLFAVYKHAKMFRWEAKKRFSNENYFELPRDSQGKVILDLSNYDASFVHQAKFGIQLFPEIGNLNRINKLASRQALTLMAPNSIREVLGGTDAALSFFALIAKKVPAYRLELSENIEIGTRDVLNLTKEYYNLLSLK